MKKLFKNKFCSVPVAMMMLVSSESFAQNVLEEIIVSVTKRDESIQDVPVSVSAITGEQIQDLGIVDMEGLSLYVPNFEINSAAVVPNLYIRGLGGGLTHSIEQSVGRYVDGVYIGRAVINTHGFMDVAGVEVLRGPQGTLFGKNTVAGALILRTAEPTDTFEAGINLSAGEYSTRGGNTEVQAYVSGPITDELTGRLAVRYREDDSFYTNRLDGPDGADRTDEGVRLKLEWAPNDQFTANLKLEYSQYDYLGSNTGEMPSLARGTLEQHQAIAPDYTPELDYNIFQDCTETPAVVGGETISTAAFCPSRDQDYTNATLKLDYEVDAGTFTSITAFQEYNYEYNFSALDGGLTQAFKAQRDEEYSSFSQELRFTSTADENLDYIVGLYYEDSDLKRNQVSDFNFTHLFGPGPYLGRSEPWEQDTQSWAAFGQLRWSFTDTLSMIFGGRYADEEKDFAFERFFRDYESDVTNGARGGPGGPALSVSDSRSEGKFTGSITAQWDVSDDANLYVSFAQGHKTGGFSDRIDNPNAIFEFDEETNNTLEIGAKTTWLEGALAFNAALFYMSIDDLQAAAGTRDANGIQVFSVTNAAEATSQGLEMDVIWNVNEWLRLGGNYAYTDATFDSFPGAECPPDQTPDADGTCDLAGRTLTFAPETKGSVYADVYLADAIGEWDVNLHADINYADDAWSNITYSPVELIESHTISNASIRFVSPSEKYSFTLLGKNLSDEMYCAWCLTGGPASLNTPREISLRLSAKFD